jgi:hypothetical protein
MDYPRAAGKFAAACREIAGARDILQKFENLSEISTYDFAFL